jgi:hypothetical protein
MKVRRSLNRVNYIYGDRRIFAFFHGLESLKAPVLMVSGDEGGIRGDVCAFSDRVHVMRAWSCGQAPDPRKSTETLRQHFQLQYIRSHKDFVYKYSQC